MKYIDKAKDRDRGNSLSDMYLQTCCKTIDPLTHSVRYMNVDYAGTFTPYRKKLAGILMENQQRFCCYCMRKLNGKERVTLEHIIPQTASPAELSYYQSIKELSLREVVLTCDFVRSNNQNFPPYPHTVAYNNLVASCDGTFPDRQSPFSSCCCNEKRGSKRAFPIYYLPNVESDILEYLPNGQVMAKIGTGWYQQTYDTIGSTKLNCKALVDIRKLWYLLRTVDYQSICDCREEEKRKYLLAKILFDGNFNAKEGWTLYEKFVKIEYWRTFMLYYWFYNYYKKHYAA